MGLFLLLWKETASVVDRVEKTVFLVDEDGTYCVYGSDGICRSCVFLIYEIRNFCVVFSQSTFTASPLLR